MARLLTRVLVTPAVPLVLGLFPAATEVFGQHCEVVWRVRQVDYASRQAEPEAWGCRVSAPVVDSEQWACACGHSAPSATSYPVTVITPAGDHNTGDACEPYTPPYTAWCRAGISNAASATTSPSDMVAAALSDSMVTLRWRDNSANCVLKDTPWQVSPAWQSFRIERKSAGGSFAQIAMVGSSPEFVDSAVSYGQTYTYRVRGYDYFGSSPYTNEATVTVGAPAAPADVQGASGAGWVHVRWSDRSADENGFRIERRTAGGSFGVLATVGADETAYLDTTVQQQTAYAYRVTAFHSLGSSPPASSGLVCGSGPAATPPPVAPCCLAAAAQQGNGGLSVTLTWSDRSADETGFRVERRPPGGTWAVIAQLPAQTSSYEDRTVAPRSTYEYRVAAYNAAGASPTGEVRVATP